VVAVGGGWGGGGRGGDWVPEGEASRILKGVTAGAALQSVVTADADTRRGRCGKPPARGTKRRLSWDDGGDLVAGFTLRANG
jgi:hypothetical protein